MERTINSVHLHCVFSSKASIYLLLIHSFFVPSKDADSDGPSVQENKVKKAKAKL